MRARLAAFESVFSALRAAGPADSERLLQRVRAVDDPVAILRQEESGSPLSPSTASPSGRASSAATMANTRQTSPGTSPQASPGPVPGPAGAQAPSLHATSRRQSVDSLLNKDDTMTAAAAAVAAATTAAATAAALAPAATALAFPDRATAERAVADFYANQGALFHVFAEDETRRHLDAVFRADDNGHVALCCLAAVAAVGMRFSSRGDVDRVAGDAAYGLAKQHFEQALDASPVLAAKLAALLALYNVMARNTMARVWIGAWFCLARRWCGVPYN